MACTTCKKTKADIAEDILIKEFKDKKGPKKIRDYFFKTILFLILAIIMTPILIPIFIIVLFKMVVLSKELNLLPIVSYIGRKIFRSESDEDWGDDEDSEEYDNLDENDYELLDENQIIKLD